MVSIPPDDGNPLDQLTILQGYLHHGFVWDGETASAAGSSDQPLAFVATSAITARIDGDHDQRRQPDEEERDDQRPGAPRRLGEFGSDQGDHDDATASSARGTTDSPAARRSKKASSRR